ncbi:MAG: ATP-binding protein [Dehalococcoidia bacterium]|nr:ATP-binding protein [Dehalococcoidia bacterium]
MSQTPFEHAGSLQVGTVDFVSPDEIKVALDIDAPESVALNTGTPRPFPRVNGYVLVPVDEGFLVGQVVWLTVERSPFPKRRGMQDFGLVDLPYPQRKLSMHPLGMLRSAGAGYAFSRGADVLPSVGAAAVLPTDAQLRSIVESGERRRVKIGTSPLAGDADVCIDPDRIFGRHLAILGNTGSGKSCSVAGLIRWSLEQAHDVQAAKAGDGDCPKYPNARFIVLDPNGEYSRAFGDDDMAKARIFRVDPGVAGAALKVPLWFWNSAEWSSFTMATARTQRPLLRRALREVKAGRLGVAGASAEERKLALRRYLSSRLIAVREELRSGTIQSDESRFGFRLRAIGADLLPKMVEFPDNGLDSVQSAIRAALAATHNSFDKNGETIEYYRAFSEEQIEAVIDALQTAVESVGGIVYQDGPDEDVPLQFRGADLVDHLESLAQQENVSQYLDFLISRMRTFLSDRKMRSIIADTEETTIESWLNDYVGSNNAADGCVSVIDLSLVPSEVVHVVTAVIARMIFEALQRYLKLNGVTLPTVLVMEEAHTFVGRYRQDMDEQDSATVCCQVFERIAREGRKFGLGLVLSSQRPSELSPTVLSQCNTFLLHRITNDRDQELVNRLVPDNLRGLLRDLPSLPSQTAILLGWASELPVLVRMNDLPTTQQPRSDDPKFWDVWVGKAARTADWGSVGADWQAGSAPVPDGGV